MKKLTTCIIILCIGLQFINAKEKGEDFSKTISSLKNKQEYIEKEVKRLIISDKDKEVEISQLQNQNTKQQSLIDSLQTALYQLASTQSNDRITFNGQIEKTNTHIQANESSLSERTVWGVIIGIVALITLISITYLLLKKIKKGNSSIDEVRKAQDTLHQTQVKLQEESIKLDNKLLEIAEKQFTTVTTTLTSDNAEMDHSLVKKVADEIVRIEMNLSRMDNTVRGYKQLAKAVQRIKDNFSANEYEIVDMLGKQYNSGMKVIANFALDETLEAGQQIITGIVKPQINYQGRMIQAAQIMVSQNI